MKKYVPDPNLDPDEVMSKYRRLREQCKSPNGTYDIEKVYDTMCENLTVDELYIISMHV